MFRLSFYPIADSYLLVCGAAVALSVLMILGPARSRTTQAPGQKYLVSRPGPATVYYGFLIRAADHGYGDKKTC